jgi:hypothetical protein
VIESVDANAAGCTTQEQSLYRLGNKRYPIVSYCRDMMWHLSPWHNKNLDHWLETVKPELILFVPNDYSLAFDIVKYIKKKTKAPMVTFYMDDPFYYNQKTKGINHIRRKRLLALGKETAAFSEKLFTTCDLMSEEYSVLLNKECHPFGNCVDMEKYSEDGVGTINEGNDLVLSYIGNLHSNRWTSLVEIGEQIDLINRERKMNATLRVYSASDLDKEVLDKITSIKCIDFKGAIPATEVLGVQRNSDILIHVEARDEISKASTRLSVSTKIFEYLAIGKPIFAYGPNDIASLQFLEKTKASVNCYEQSDLKPLLLKLLTSLDLRKDLGLSGREYALANCDINKESERFADALLRVYDQGKANG